jgi:hypothetical protein
VWAALLAALCFYTSATEKLGEKTGIAFGWYFVYTAVVSTVEVFGLLGRRKFAYNLGMIICFSSFMNLPVGAILTILLITGLAKQRQWLDR